ncbi:hypothetical protein [Massilia sp. YIM B02443]|nr:hypothetical protein [Massilia sp. YIM B02443]MDN4036638.1 hypothetical protein [Massilia sp. YIM B02443]
MSAMQIVVLVFYVVIGIPNKIIDRKHRKREGMTAQTRLSIIRA